MFLIDALAEQLRGWLPATNDPGAPIALTLSVWSVALAILIRRAAPFIRRK